MKVLNLINGVLSPASSSQWLDLTNPSEGKTYGHLPRSGSADVELAVSAANSAFKSWAATPAGERAACMSRLADLVRDNADMLAEAESRDNGKPVSLAGTVDIPRAEKNLRFYASAIQHFASESHVMEGVALNYTLRKPLGVVACISPWNLPLYLFTWKVAPALVSGNCVVAKPSEITPVTAYLLSTWVKEAGFPDGVFNIIHGLGSEVGDALIRHPKVTAISFTGGTATGAHIASVTAPKFKKLSLELGGKNAAIIFDDCDFDDALATTLRSSFANQGQICLCGSRILVEKSLYPRFRDALVAKAKKMKVGDPMDPSTKMGAVVSKDHRDKILASIELAKTEGGKILCGGEKTSPEGLPHLQNGYYVQPTIIEGLSPNCRVNQEEIFGPVVTIQPFENEEEALEMANNSEYGLAATVWTNDLKQAHRVSSELETGIVWVNCWLLRDLRTPFGGVKNSGVGREGGFEALQFFTEPQNVCIKL
ncbi:MAG TPA: aldehyde dehydrogenase [Flavobacteriales bacterium]|nr:aldehyde dehydrogenase [Flavobacteriales bacterium]HHZ97892.1 aldehyde dehydrogenase [Flavobacteriales bacterium]HIB77057.1 aldehyde dehydrogenase [Flavobacteriales bacterium]HIO59168.1 aldehyde dehydrogenase [Flavobacteriales bacterium]